MLFFTGGAFIVIRHILKLVLQFQFDLQSPLKQPKMLIFEKWKNMVFGPNYGIFWPKGDLKPCIRMYLGNIHNMSLVPVTFGNFFFKSSKNGTFWAKLRRVKMAWTFLLYSTSAPTMLPSAPRPAQGPVSGDSCDLGSPEDLISTVPCVEATPISNNRVSRLTLIIGNKDIFE